MGGVACEQSTAFRDLRRDALEARGKNCNSVLYFWS
jgi:hypothetical protein